ncbi:Maltose/maltodextrin-binding protein [Thalassocella blandensis]|nr:Maltose/maltodextrin-binding protein [Thalassocella blandensis]
MVPKQSVSGKILTVLKRISVFLMFMLVYADGLAQTKPNTDSAVIQVIYTSTDPVLAEAVSSFKSDSSSRFQFQWIDQSELKTRLLEQKEDEDMPEIIMASEDLLGLHREVHFSAITANAFRQYVNADDQLLQSALSEDNQIYGLPVVKGNHLVMYYQREFVQTVASSWHELLGQRYSVDPNVELVGWSVLDMYWLIPFISAFGELPVQGNEIIFDVEGIAKSLTFVWNLIDKNVVDLNCDYNCTVDKFLQGKLAYHINGVWEYERFKKQLGEQLGVAPLPSINGKPMQPYYANIYLMFPRKSLTGPHADAIQQFIAYTKSTRFNALLKNSMSSFSLNREALKAREAAVDENVDRKFIQDSLENAYPMPHHQDMFLVWEAMLNGFVRYGGGSIEDYQAAGYMQNYVDNNQ